MNYTQVLEQIEQLKTGKKMPDADNILEKISVQNIIYIPADYEYDFVGELLELLLKEQNYSVGRFTPYAIKSPVGHILCQGKSISQKDFTVYAEEVLGEIKNNMKTFFRTEVNCSIAFKYFLNKNVDFIIWPSLHKCSIECLKEVLSEASVLEREKTVSSFFLETVSSDS